MNPSLFLLLIVLATALAAGGQWIANRRRQTRLRELAVSSGMNFIAGDQLRLGERVAQYLPICGAANVTVQDVIYGIDGQFYRYIFRTEYTLGVLRYKRRHSCIASLSEPRDRNRPPEDERVELADERLPLMEQYQELIKQRQKPADV